MREYRRLKSGTVDVTTGVAADCPQNKNKNKTKPKPTTKPKTKTKTEVPKHGERGDKTRGAKTGNADHAWVLTRFRLAGLWELPGATLLLSCS